VGYVTTALVEDVDRSGGSRSLYTALHYRFLQTDKFILRLGGLGGIKQNNWLYQTNDVATFRQVEEERSGAFFATAVSTFSYLLGKTELTLRQMFELDTKSNITPSIRLGVAISL
jgi:hypothetical protein